MLIKTPKFWYRPLNSSPALIETILTPFSSIYKLGHHLNLNSTQTKSVDIPVICIGNITAGGSGKTPTILALHKLLIDKKIFTAPHFLSRGYGGTKGNARCIKVHDDANDVGDEPLLLASHSKTIVSVNRYEGAKMMQELGADCVMMDDGFQNISLYKDISFLVIDGKMGLGNQKLIPAGPLREPIAEALNRAQAIIIIGEDKTEVQSLIPKNISVFKASIQASNIESICKTQPYIAFAGLGNPLKFYDTLQQNGINVVAFHEFADHYPYNHKDMDALIKEANEKCAKLLTTEKDYHRIPDNRCENIHVFPIELIFENDHAVADFIIEYLDIQK